MVFSHFRLTVRQRVSNASVQILLGVKLFPENPALAKKSQGLNKMSVILKSPINETFTAFTNKPYSHAV